jgi:hypothetical protein
MALCSRSRSRSDACCKECISSRKSHSGCFAPMTLELVPMTHPLARAKMTKRYPAWTFARSDQPSRQKSERRVSGESGRLAPPAVYSVAGDGRAITCSSGLSAPPASAPASFLPARLQRSSATSSCSTIADVCTRRLVIERRWSSSNVMKVVLDYTVRRSRDNSDRPH